MESLYKMVGIALIGGVALSILRKNEPEMTTVVTTAIAIFTVGLIMPICLSFREQINAWSSEYESISDMYDCMMKLAGCSFVSEASSKLCMDSGMQTMAYILKYGGTIVGILVAMPAYRQLIAHIEAMVG